MPGNGSDSSDCEGGDKMKCASRSGMMALIVAVFVTLMWPAAAAAAPLSAAEWTYVVDAPLGLRLHNEAGLLTDVLLVLYEGEDVRVEGDPVYVDGLWWRQVRVERRAGDFTGWVASAYLANGSAEMATEGPESGDVYVVTARPGLKLRTAAGLTAAIVSRVPRGTRLQATGAGVRRVDGLVWRQFSLGDETVWAADAYLEPVQAE